MVSSSPAKVAQPKSLWQQTQPLSDSDGWSSTRTSEFTGGHADAGRLVTRTAAPSAATVREVPRPQYVLAGTNGQFAAAYADLGGRLN